MSYIILLVGAILFANASMGQEDADSLARKFTVLPLEQRVMSNLPQGREPEVIAQLIQRGYIVTLLRINHGPTVEKIIGEYLEKEGKSMPARRDIGDSGSPYLVEKLAPALYKGDQLVLRSWGEGEVDLGQSAAAALLVGELLMKSPEFPAEVKEWAHRNLAENSAVSIAVARQFWELNQEALKAQRFDQVAPPKGVPKSARSPSPADSSVHATGAVRPTKRPLPPTVVSMPPQAVGWTGLWWVIGLLIALIFCFVIIRKKA